MKKSLTKTQVINLNNTLFGLQKETTTKSFSYLVSRNISKLKPEIEAIQEASKPSEAFIAYERARLEICTVNAEKNEDGSPKSEGNMFLFSDENKVKVAEELAKLFQEHQVAVEEHNKQQMEINNMLADEIEIEVHPISFKLFPQSVSAEQIDYLLPLIKETEDEITEIIANEE